MKNKLLLIVFLIPLLNGCSWVSCNHVFPKPEWYWQYEARACRKEHEIDKQRYLEYSKTNKISTL